MNSTSHILKYKYHIKKVTPKFVRHLYNRCISKNIIRRSIGNWFELEWKTKAQKSNSEQWIKAYDSSWDNWKQQDLSPEDIEKIRNLISKGSTLLDVGCGDGFLLEHLLDKADYLFGLDVSGTGLTKARKRLNNKCQFVQAFLERLPFDDDSFETVVTTHTLEHVKDLQNSVRELKRVTSKRLIILVPSQEYLPYTMDYHLHFFPNTNDLLEAVEIPDANIQRYTIPAGLCAYQGDVLILHADLNK